MYHRSIDSSPSILPVNTFVYSRVVIQGVSIRIGLDKRPVYMAIKLLWYKTGQILRYTERKPFNFCAIIYYRTILWKVISVKGLLYVINVVIKRMRYFASARLSIWRKANRTLVYQSRLSTPRWPSAEIFNTRVSQHRDSLHGCGCDLNACRSCACDSRLQFRIMDDKISDQREFLSKKFLREVPA